MILTAAGLVAILLWSPVAVAPMNHGWRALWDFYEWFVLTGVTLILAEILLLLGLLKERRGRRKAELELANAEQRLRLTVEGGQAVGWDWDVSSGRGRMFGDLRTVLGIQSDDCSGDVEDFRRRVHPEDRGLFWQAISNARQNRRPYHAEFRVVRDDEAVRWIASSGRFYYAPNGEAERMLGMAVDITDRKKAERALMRSEEKFSAAFRESPMAFTLTSAIDHRYLDVNETFERITGWHREEVIGKTSADLHIWSEPSQRAEAVKQLLAGGTIRNVEVPFRCKNGARRVGLSSAGLIEIEGETCVVSVVADVTDRKQMEDELLASQQRLKGVVASPMDAIITIDEQRRILLFNVAAEHMLGCPAGQAIGTRIDRFIPRPFRAMYRAYLRYYGKSSAINRAVGTLWAVRTDGEEFPIETSISYLETDEKKLFTLIVRDITERSGAEEAPVSLSGRLIEAQEEERRRIASEIHDDYNQRLALVAIDLEELAEHVGDPGIDHRRRLCDLWEKVSELGADLHSLSHRLHSSTLESLGLVAATSAFCEEFGHQQGIRIDFAHRGVPNRIKDEIALSLFRVVQEGLRNIKRHSGADHAEVHLECLNNTLFLSVIDQGKGFDNSAPSSGIGIRSMRERLRSLGGQLEIHSRPMEGTRVRATVPLAAAGRHAA
jgi:PAS domain S-box-containing protein